MQPMTIHRQWTAALAASVLAACSSKATQGDGRAVVSGLVQADALVASSVTLRDSSSPPQARTVNSAKDGSFAIDVSGLKTPFKMRAQWTGLVGSRQLFGTASGAGAADLNQLTDAAFAGAAASRGTAAAEFDRSGDAARTLRDVTSLLQQMQAVMAPLFDLYGISNPAADVRAVRALLRDVRFTARDGVLVVTNRATGAVIFTGPLDNLAAGSFDEDATPLGPAAALDGAALYAENCAGCHGPLASSEVSGARAREIRAAIAENEGGMGALTLSGAEIRAIARALSGGGGGGGGGGGTDGAALYAENCAGCHGSLSNSNVSGASASQIQAAINANVGGMGSLSNLTADQISAIASALGGGGGGGDGAALYTANCASCHGSLSNSNVSGASASQIQAAINANVGGMGSLSNLTADQISAIAGALGGGGGGGGGGGAALYTANCASCHGPLNSSSVRGASANDIREAIDENEGGMGSLRGLTDTEIQAIAGALGGGGGGGGGEEDD